MALDGSLGDLAHLTCDVCILTRGTNKNHISSHRVGATENVDSSGIKAGHFRQRAREPQSANALLRAVVLDHYFQLEHYEPPVYQVLDPYQLHCHEYCHYYPHIQNHEPRGHLGKYTRDLLHRNNVLAGMLTLCLYPGVY